MKSDMCCPYVVSRVSGLRSFSRKASAGFGAECQNQLISLHGIYLLSGQAVSRNPGRFQLRAEKRFQAACPIPSHPILSYPIPDDARCQVAGRTCRLGTPPQATEAKSEYATVLPPVRPSVFRDSKKVGGSNKHYGIERHGRLQLTVRSWVMGSKQVDKGQGQGQ